MKFFCTGMSSVTEFYGKKGDRTCISARISSMNKMFVCLAATAAMAAATMQPAACAEVSPEGKSIEAKIVDSRKKNQEMKENLSGLDNQIHKLERELSEITGQIEQDAGAKAADEKKRGTD